MVYRETKVTGKYAGLLCGRNENGLVKGGCHLASLDAQCCIEHLMLDLTDWEAQGMADLESCGIRGWMGCNFANIKIPFEDLSSKVPSQYNPNNQRCNSNLTLPLL